MTLHAALERLLTDRDARGAFFAGTLELALSEEDAEALTAVGLAHIEATAGEIRRHLARRTYRGSGGLATLYAGTLGDRDLDELVGEFMASPQYGNYRELPHAGAGQCLEEAFYRFCADRGIGEPDVREAEFLEAMSRALAVSANPSFVVPAEMRPVRFGFFAVSSTGVLYAAVGGRFVRGALTPFLSELLLSDDDPAVVAARHGAGRTLLAAAVARFEEMGLR